MQAETTKGRGAEATARGAKMRLVSLCVCVNIGNLTSDIFGKSFVLGSFVTHHIMGKHARVRAHTHTQTHTHTIHVGATAREALLTSRSKVRVLERFASLNLMAVVKIVKKHDKLVRKFAPGVGKALSSQVVAFSCNQS